MSRGSNGSNPNRQRDHQANERTFLAWLRTAIALIGFGFAIARFGLFTREIQSALASRPFQEHVLLDSERLGIGLVVLGVLSIAIAAWRYQRVFSQIERQDYRPSSTLIWLVTAIVMGLGTLSIPLIIGRVETPAKTNPPQSK
ncbi:MAG: DUF202 domain-containing protein [Thermosynechococcaceae cyanobacterium MS004]|nr:DUF202 domain-containing protein [Thermosynechococcaceae cyanobacterium MS004]